MSKKQTAESFWRRVKIGGAEECWEWTGARNNTGYGTVAWGGKVYTSHRVAAWLNGMVDSLAAPEKSHIKGHVLHKCDNRSCCNPDHFFIGSYTDNQKDAYSKKRKVQPKGENHSNAKLTAMQVETIRNEYALGRTQVELAREFGVSQRSISLIVRKETYK